MNGRLKRFLKTWLPAPVARMLSSLRYGRIRYTGPHQTWAAAEAVSTGYDADIILSRTRQAALRVKRGEAAYERDSILFDQPDLPFPLLTALMMAAALDDGRLVVYDFGGSLGSLYYRCRPFLERLPGARWVVIEQRHVVDCGQSEFADGTLFFSPDFQHALAQHGAPSIVVASAVLYLVEATAEIVDTIVGLQPKMIFVDRTIFSDDDEEHVFVQHVPPSLYAASYPAKFLCWPVFAARFKPAYSMVSRFDSWEGEVRSENGTKGRYLGAYWTLASDRLPS